MECFPKFKRRSRFGWAHKEKEQSQPTLGSEPEAPPPDTHTLKQQLQSCLKHFKDLIATALESLKVSVLAKTHFSVIEEWLDKHLLRLEACNHHAGLNDPAVVSNDLDPWLKERSASLLKNIMSRLESVRKDIQVKRAAAEQMSESGLTDPEDDYNFYSHTKGIILIVSYYILRERIRPFEKHSQQIEAENKAITIIVFDLTNLMDAASMNQSVNACKSPLVGLGIEGFQGREQVRDGSETPPVSPYARDDEYTELAGMGIQKPKERRSMGHKLLLSGREN